MCVGASNPRARNRRSRMLEAAPSDAIDRKGVSVLSLSLKRTWDQGTLPNGPDRAAGLTRNPPRRAGGRKPMAETTTSRTYANLLCAVAREMIASRRYLACASVAEEEDRREAAVLF